LSVYTNAEIVNEVQSGVIDRLIFDRLSNDIEPGYLVCSTRLDRFCWTTKEGVEYNDAILSKVGRIYILNMGLIENTPFGRLIVTHFLAFAEFVWAQILERCADGRVKARLVPGYKDG